MKAGAVQANLEPPNASATSSTTLHATAKDLTHRGAQLSVLRAQVDELTAILTQKQQQIAVITRALERELSELAAENAALRQRLEEREDGSEETAPPDADTPKARHLPSLTALAGNLAKAAAKAATTAVRGGHVLADEDVVQRRVAVCRSGECDRYVRDSDRCAECGCFVAPKAKLATEDCPLGLWTGEAPLAVETEGVDIDSRPAASPVTPRIRVVLFADPEHCQTCVVAGQLLHGLRSRTDVEPFELEEINPSRAPDLARQYDISAVPTFLFFREAQLLRRHEGLASEADLEKEVAATISGQSSLAARDSSGISPRTAQDPSSFFNAPLPADLSASFGSPTQSSTSSHLSLELQQAEAELAMLASGPRNGVVR